jgi:cytoskeletal protein CcmA (bactofilin family)
MISCIKIMAEEKTSILLSDVSVDGEVVEKDKIIIDAKITGDIKAQEIITHSKSFIKGNIKSKSASIGGKLEGNISSDSVSVKKTANIEGVLNQKSLSIQEGARLKIKAETNK